MQEFWNKRYSSDEYVYGTNPNGFFKERLDLLPAGKILLPGEGEGRNALYAAQKGWQVKAFDWSEKAKLKALQLAKQAELQYEFAIHTFDDFQPEPNRYDAVGLIFIHPPIEQRKSLHQKVIDSLKPGGHLILEAFDKEQLGKNSGGPQDEDLLYSMAELVEDFIELDFEILTKVTLKLNEGQFHEGEASVVRFCGVKI